MAVSIRPAVPQEADALTALALAGKRHWGYPESWLEDWREALSISSAYIEAQLVSSAEDEAGRVVGFYALERAGERLRLEHLWLAPSLIGTGLGRRLFEHAVESARALGATELFIEADPNAEGFYLHMGAKRIGETVSHVAGEERILPQLWYSLSDA